MRLTLSYAGAIQDRACFMTIGVRIVKDLSVDFRLSMIISMMCVTNHFPPRRAVHSGDHRTPTAESTC